MIPLLLFGALFLLGSALREALALHRKLRHSLRTTGRLRDFVERRDSDGDRTTLARIDFDVDGVAYTFETSGMGGHPVGATVPVVYLPADPRESALLPDRWAYADVVIFGLAGVVGVACTLCAFFEHGFYRFCFPSLY